MKLRFKSTPRPSKQRPSEPAVAFCPFGLFRPLCHFRRGGQVNRETRNVNRRKMKMKTITLSLCALCLAGPAFCADKAELDAKIRMLATKLETLQDKPDKAVPPADLNKAVGIILLDRTKAGFFF